MANAATQIVVEQTALTLGEIEQRSRGLRLVRDGVENITTMERILYWVFSEQRCRMPWFENADLSFDKGLTAKPRRRDRGGWAMAEARAGLRGGVGKVRVAVPIAPDADIVLEAVKRLPARQAAMIITHGRQRSRPDAMLGIEARLRPVWRDEVKRIPKVIGTDKYRNYGYCLLEWEVSPLTIATARLDASEWQAGIRTLEEILRGLTINGWII